MESIMSLTWWQFMFFMFGIIAFISVIISIFIPSETLTDDLKIEKAEAVDSPDFLKSISRLVNSPVSKGGEVEFLNNADEFLIKVLEDIEKSEKSINFTNYIWKSGKFSDVLFDALINKQKSGVEVRLLLDTLGGKFAPKDKSDELRMAGGQVKFFRTPRFGRLSRFHKRNHRRAVVIDGNIGYTGGVAIDDKWLESETNKNNWHDSMIRVTGPMAFHTQSAFAQLWTSTTGEILSGEKFYPEIETGKGVVSLNLLSSPAEDTQPLPHFYWYSIKAAKKSVHLTNPYFLPPKSILEALKEAKSRGVDVKIILPSELTDAKHVRWASHTNYEEMLNAGVQIFEYSKSRLHSKHLVVDGAWSVIGSANMDNRSMILNQENIIGISDPEFGQIMEKVFTEDLGNSKEIRLSEWKKRSSFLKGLERISAVLAKQY